MEKYSFLMSVYYKEKPRFLQESIESMLAQTAKPDEIIIVEDGPLTDGLNAVIDGYKNTFPELFNIIKLKTNGGLGHALNIGIKASKNELIARMDSDDISLPNRCERQLREFEADPSLTVVGTQLDEFINDAPDNIVSSRIVPTTNEGIVRFARRRSPFNHATVMYRKSVLVKMRGYHTSGRKEDLDLFIRMVNHHCKAKNIDKSLYLVRSNSDNVMRRKTWQNCSEYIEIMYGFYKKGYCSFVDLAYVTIGQLALFLSPVWLTSLLTERFLRKKA